MCEMLFKNWKWWFKNTNQTRPGWSFFPWKLDVKQWERERERERVQVHLFYSTLLSLYFIVHSSGSTAIWIIKDSTFPLANRNLEFLTTLLDLPLCVWEKKKMSAEREAKQVLPNPEEERNVCLSITELPADIVFCWE